MPKGLFTRLDPAGSERLSLRLGLALLAGMALPLAFAPFGLHFLAVLSPALLFALWMGQGPRAGLLVGYAFGLGQFGVGVSWLYHSFTLFGAAIAPVAALVTAAFVAVAALYPALAGYLVARFSGGDRVSALWLAPLLWVGVEWLRGWLFGGFPWLNLGAAFTDGPLGGVLPVFGEYGASLWAALLAAALVALLQARRHRTRWLVAAAVVASLALGQALRGIDWTEPDGDPIRVGMAQGNIPQMRKFDPEILNFTLRRYLSLTEDLPPVDLVLWPETAIPEFIEALPEFRELLAERARRERYVMLVGAFDEDGSGQYFNTMQGIPSRLGSYAKRHLVPFGEYLPLRGLLEAFHGLIDVPMADLSPGPAVQALPVVRGRQVGVSICYEAALSREIRRALPEASLLVNASNDSWFGDSLAPDQHLQIARVRSMEFGRPMARATNTGISAFIDHRGRLLETTRFDETAALAKALQPMSGSTPFARWGNWPLFLMLLPAIAWLALRARRIIRRNGSAV
ncbi:MAG: apolipoprotein N-acyltransferase [Halothiobacillaceae bacterium]